MTQRSFTRASAKSFTRRLLSRPIVFPTTWNHIHFTTVLVVNLWFYSNIHLSTIYMTYPVVTIRDNITYYMKPDAATYSTVATISLKPVNNRRRPTIKSMCPRRKNKQNRPLMVSNYEILVVFQLVTKRYFEFFQSKQTRYLKIVYSTLYNPRELRTGGRNSYNF